MTDVSGPSTTRSVSTPYPADAIRSAAWMQQHQAESPWTYTYDNAGNQTVEDAGGAVTTNAYDPENRLTVVAHPDGTLSTYTYQGYDGLRRSKHEPGGVLTTFVWDGSDYLGEY